MNLQTTVLIAASALLVLGAGAFIAFYVSRKHNSSEDWIVGGRSLPIYVLAFTQYATAVGGGVLVAHVGIAYSWGISVFWYELFLVIGMLIVAVFANWLRKRKFATIPEVFTRLFGENRALLTVVAIAVIVVPFGWLATQFVAFAGLFSQVTGISFVPLIIALAVVSLLFVLPGGLTSVAWSDFFFGVFMLVTSVVVGGYAIYAAGGPSEIMSNIPQEIVSVPEGFGSAGAMTVLLWAFAIIPGTITNQLYYQRVFAAKSVREARSGIYLGAVMVFFAGFYALAIGVAVRSMNGTLGVDGREQAAGWFLTQVPVWLLALYGAFLMATIVSTTGSALQSVVANMVYDLRNAFVSQERLQETNMVSVSRWATVAVTAVAAVLAIAYPQALDWLVATYAYSASILAVPLVGGMVLSRRGPIPPAVAFISMGVGLITCAVAHVLGTTIPYAIFGIAASLIAFVVAHAVVTPTDRGNGTPAQIPEASAGQRG